MLVLGIEASNISYISTTVIMDCDEMAFNKIIKDSGKRE